MNFTQGRHLARAGAEIDTDRVHPRIGSGRVESRVRFKAILAVCNANNTPAQNMTPTSGNPENTQQETA